VRRGERGDLGVVVGRGDLDDIAADEPQAEEAPQDPEELAARQPARLGRAGPRGRRWIEDVDVDRDVDGQSPTRSRIRWTTPSMWSDSRSIAGTI